MGLTLITGGARSGKSRWAEQLASRYGNRVWYVATAATEPPESGLPDLEMRRRIDRHRARRPAEWLTLEAPDDVRAAVETVLRDAEPPDAMLLDCLTLLMSNWLLAAGGGSADLDRLLRRAEDLAAWLAGRPFPVLVVTNEVGGGVVPVQALARTFRDLAGLANQIFAGRADSVYLVCSGIPVELRALDARRERL